jgi:diadenylate cyclase
VWLQEWEFTSTKLAQIVDIIIVSFLIYRALLVIRGTRAAPMLGGLTVIAVVYFVAKPLGFVTLAWLIDNFLSSIILVVVVIFQDEIRRGLTKVGVQPFRFKPVKELEDKTIEELVLTATKLGKLKTGALIVLQREVGLDEFLQEGVPIDAHVSRKLLYSIFVKESPLHDGAVIIDGDRIRAAGCVLPLSYNPDLDPNLGTRHRAALGLSERSDAVIVVVSEESGAISLISDGKIQRHLDPVGLRENLDALTKNGNSRKLSKSKIFERGLK